MDSCQVSPAVNNPKAEANTVVLSTLLCTQIDYNPHSKDPQEGTGNFRQPPCGSLEIQVSIWRLSTWYAWKIDG